MAVDQIGTPAAVSAPDVTMANDPIKIVLYRDQEATAPIHVNLSWEQLTEFLTIYVEESPCTVEGPGQCIGKKCPYKSHSAKADNPMAWSPVDIDGKRLDINVRHLTLLILDFDHIDETAARTVISKLAPWEHVLHTTHNNRVGDFCFRAILRLSRQVHVNQWHRFLAAAISFLGVTVTSKENVEQPDKTCKNRSRFYYRPSHPVGAPTDTKHGVGQILDVDAVLAWADANMVVTPAYEGSSRPLPEESDWDIDSDAVVNAIDVVARYFPPTRRHDLCMAVGGMLRRAGASAEVAHYVVHEIAVQGGSDDPEARSATVWHTYGLDDESAAMTGFTRVAEIIGDDIAEEFGDFLTDARNETLLRGWEKTKKRLAESGVLPAAAIAPTTPAAPIVVDLAELRKEIVNLAATRSRSLERDDKIDAILLRRVLHGEPIARPGGVGDVETVREEAQRGIGRSTAIHKVVGMIAFAFPEGTPWGAALEILRASLIVTPVDPGERSWIDKSEKIYKRSQDSRKVKAAQEQMAQAEYVERLRTSALAASGGSSSLVTIQSTPSGPPDGPDWMDKLTKASNGALAQTLHNARMLLRNHPDFMGSLRWNEITKDVEVHSGVLRQFSALGIEGIVAGAQDYLASVHGLAVQHRDLARRVVAVARDNSYDPLKTYLLNLKWDGEDRICNWLGRYAGAIDDDSVEASYVRNIGKRWLIAAAARGLNPGCKCDTMLILESDKQGIGKSTLFDILGGAFFSETPIDIHNKDSRMMAALNWVIEMAELQSFKTADFLKMKAFLSQRVDKFRPPYAASMESFSRRCIFGGTTNQRMYLTDDTGNRRYWSVLVTKIDTGALERDRDQVFAQAVYLYLAAESCNECAEIRQTGSRKRCDEHRWWLSDDEEGVAATESAKRDEEVPWILQIHEWWLSLKPEHRPSMITSDDIASEVLNTPLERITSNLRTQIGIAVKKLEFRKKRIMFGGKQHWFYVPNEKLLKLPQQAKVERVKPRALFAIPGGKIDKPGEKN